MIDKSEIKKLISLRRSLHSEPELSGSEKRTAEKIISFCKQYSPDKIIKDIGGNGVAIIFDSNEIGPSVLFRAELDALPITEVNNFNYKSIHNGIAHKCGHDGHAAILAGLSHILKINKPKRGKVILLFQPAEETGEGAELVISDTKFKELNPDYVFALHNLPGFEMGKVILKNNVFASASKGMIIKLFGKTSHAAQPEYGLSPAIAVSELIRQINELNNKDNFNDFTMLTIIHARLGEKAFGTTPGYAELMVTLRAYQDDDMKMITNECEKIVKNISIANKLKYEIGYSEVFPATKNNNECVEMIKEAALMNQLEYQHIKHPFKWSEDFGHFTNKYKGVLFGVGAGIDHPQLHNPDYDFPDEIIPACVNLFFSIVNNLLNKK